MMKAKVRKKMVNNEGSEGSDRVIGGDRQVGRGKEHKRSGEGSGGNR